MTQSDSCPDQECNGIPLLITIDPVSFFQYAASSDDRWQELIGLSIHHSTFGLGTIRKIDGEYIYVDLPERLGKKHLTEFGLDSFQRGFFNNLQISNSLQEKITAAAEASRELLLQSERLEAEASGPPAKKKRKSPKATKKAV
jgi:hypothetical protein